MTLMYNCIKNKIIFKKAIFMGVWYGVAISPIHFMLYLWTNLNFEMSGEEAVNYYGLISRVFYNATKLDIDGFYILIGLISSIVILFSLSGLVLKYLFHVLAISANYSMAAESFSWGLNRLVTSRLLFFPIIFLGCFVVLGVSNLYFLLYPMLIITFSIYVLSVLDCDYLTSGNLGSFNNILSKVLPGLLIVVLYVSINVVHLLANIYGDVSPIFIGLDVFLILLDICVTILGASILIYWKYKKPVLYYVKSRLNIKYLFRLSLYCFKLIEYLLWILPIIIFIALWHEYVESVYHSELIKNDYSVTGVGRPLFITIWDFVKDNLGYFGLMLYVPIIIGGARFMVKVDSVSFREIAKD